jgi:serine phosphatase RsbU (regulator of sigma subunit)
MNPHQSARRDRALLVGATAFSVTLIGVDMAVPSDIRLSDMLIVEPIVVAWFAGPVAAGITWLLATAGLSMIMSVKGIPDHLTELTALIMVAVFSTAMCYLRERRGRELRQVRTVAEAAQRAVLRPLPHQVGPLRLSTLYLAAEDEAQIGGDLYAVARTSTGTRLIIGDVRGKGLTAVGDAAVLLGAFRGAAHRGSPLTELAAFLEASISSEITHLAEPSAAWEGFITAALIEIPDDAPVVRLVDFGHPPPLCLRKGEVTPLEVENPSPPLGLGGLAEGIHRVETFAFDADNILLLYTDGVIEARDSKGTFFPLAERLTELLEDRPNALIHHIRADLLAHAGGRLGDDAAILAIERTSI